MSLGRLQLQRLAQRSEAAHRLPVGTQALTCACGLSLAAARIQNKKKVFQARRPSQPSSETDLHTDSRAETTLSCIPIIQSAAQMPRHVLCCAHAKMSVLWGALMNK